MERKKNKQPKLKIKKGDQVQVITGVNKGQQGKVLDVQLKKRKVIVEKVNIVSKATKPNADNAEGGIVKQEAAIHISNVMLIDPKNGGVTRVGRQRDKNGKLVRFARKSGEVIK